MKPIPSDTDFIKWHKIQSYSYVGRVNDTSGFEIVFSSNRYGDIVGYTLHIYHRSRGFWDETRRIDHYENVNKRCEKIITSGLFKKLCDECETKILIEEL